ncbi:MAG: hypothetical protein ACPL3P_00220 [Anaerolineales bacterium]
MNEKQPNYRTRAILLGAVLGALVGVSAAMLLIQRAEREDGKLQVGAGEGIKLGLLVLGLLRQVAQLGEG